MDSESYRQEIQAAYIGEIWGAAFFDAMARQSTLASIQDRILLLARLEKITRARLRPLLERLALDTSVDPRHVAGGERRAEEWAGCDRLEFARRLHALVADYVPQYDALLAAGPAVDRETLEFLSAHERALLIFSERELRGETETSLDAVRDLLGEATNDREQSGL